MVCPLLPSKQVVTYSDAYGDGDAAPESGGVLFATGPTDIHPFGKSNIKVKVPTSSLLKGRVRQLNRSHPQQLVGSCKTLIV